MIPSVLTFSMAESLIDLPIPTSFPSPQIAPPINGISQNPRAIALVFASTCRPVEMTIKIFTIKLY